MSDDRRNRGGAPLLPKPYDFVPFAPEGASERAIGHHVLISSDEKRVYTGTIEADIKAESLLHVSSGLVVLVDDIRNASDIDVSSIRDDELIMSHIRCNGRRIIPGSTLKGTIRSAIEAITLSGMKFEPIPGKARSEVSQQKLGKSADPPSTSLVNRLFGITDENRGYQGQCSFYDAPQVSGGAQLFRRLPLYSPQPYESQSNKQQTDYRLYFTDAARKALRGRKFYRPGETREAGSPYTAVEACQKGAIFRYRSTFTNLRLHELGMLLIVLGVDLGAEGKILGAEGKIPQLKIGSGKPVSMGSVTFHNLRIAFWSDDIYRDYDTSTNSRQDIVEKAVEAALKSRELFTDGLAKLMEIMSNPTSHTAGGSTRKERSY